MDFGSILKFLNEIAGVLAVLATLSTIMLAFFRAKYVNKTDFAEAMDGHQAKNQQLENAITKLRSDLEHLPDTKSLHALDTELERLRGDMKALSQQVIGLGDILAKVEKPLELLIEDRLNDGGRRP